MIRLNLSVQILSFIWLFLLLSLSASYAELYKVTVNQEEQNLYKVVGADIYIKTVICYTITHYGKAILDISPVTHGGIGRIIFIDENRAECTVEKLLQEVSGVK